MKLTINKKISSVFFLLVFSILLFGLANNVFAFTEIVKLGRSVTFHYVYVGDSSLYPGYRPIDCYSVEPSGLRCDIDLGFKSTVTPMSCNNVWENNREDINIGMITGLYGEDLDVDVYWEADECDYNIYYEITGSGSVAIIGGSSTITSSGDLYCKGGTPTTTYCDPSDGWKTGSCPDSYFCPGYGRGVSGDSTFNEGSTQAVTFSKAVTKVPQVRVYGDDLIGGTDRQTVQMTVPYPTEGQDNADIYWETNDVTRCECTSSERDCTPLLGTTYSTYPGQSITAKDSPYSLTSDETFSVECW